jgi:hypothetical protein
MAAELAGTAAIRLVPSLTGFRARAQTELARQKGLSVDVDIRPKIDTSTASRQLERFRAKERADAINLKVKVDEADFHRQFQRVEHVFERSAFAKALRLQIKVVGIDALYAVAGAAAAAAAALDTAGKAALILPGALASAGVAAGVFALAMQDVKKAITAVQTEQDQAADKARALASAQADATKASRDVGRAHDEAARATENIGKATRQAIRNFEDLTHAVRGTSLDEADALLNVQESYDKLAQGGQKSLTDLRRDQLQYARDLHNLDGVRTQNKRTLEDYNDAQRKGLAGSDEVTQAQDRLVQALDAVQDAQNRVADATARMADATQTKTMVGAFSRLAPAAQEFVRAVTDAQGAWVELGQAMQQGVFEGQAANLNQTLEVLRTMRPELQGVATSLGGVFLDLGATLRRGDVQNSLRGIFTGTSATIDTLRRGLDPLVTGFLRMADVGSRHLPQLADVIDRLASRFNAWVDKIASDGTLDRWIEQGIRGFEQLETTGENIIAIIFNVANAWRAAGGEQTGLIQNAADLTTEIRKWTESTSGQDSMIQQFRNMRGWLSQVWSALQNIWPTVQGIVATVREWSAGFLTVLGWATRLTSWVQEHTGLVTAMVTAYLTIRTVKPIWDTLKNAAQGYSSLMMRIAAQSGPGFAQNAVTGLSNVQTAMGKTNTTAQTLSGTFTSQKSKLAAVFAPANDLSGSFERLSAQQAGAQKALTGVFAPANNLTGALRNANPQMSALNNNMANAVSPVNGFTGAAKNAAGAVGTRASGLWGAAAGLGAFLGPMAVAMAATGGIIWTIDKLGEAHRRAAAEAQNQNNQLSALKSTLDQFTGAFTAQTAVDTSRKLQDFTVPGVGNRNILEDIARTGVATKEQFIGATNPTQVAQRGNILAQLDKGTETAIAGSDVWARSHGKFESHGVDLPTLAKAVNGDQASIDKVRAAETAMVKEAQGPGGTGNASDTAKDIWRHTGVLTPDLTAVLTGTGTPSTATSAIALRTVSGGLTTQGAQNQAATTAAGGTGSVKPGFDKYFGANPEIYFPDGPAAAATVKTRESVPDPTNYVKNFPPEWGTAVINPDGTAQITLTMEGTQQAIEHKATGGMIRGVGSGTSDSNMIMASRGEYIIRKAAVDAIGVQHLDRMNSMSFAGGGFVVGGIPFPLGPPSPILPDPSPPFNPSQVITGAGSTPPGNPFIPAGTAAAAPPPPPPRSSITGPPPPLPSATPPPYDPTIPGTPPAPAPGDQHLAADRTQDNLDFITPALGGQPGVTPPGPAVPQQYPAQSPATTSIPYSPYNSSAGAQLPAGYGPGYTAPIPLETQNPDATKVKYLADLARQWGLRVGSGSGVSADVNAIAGAAPHDNDGKLHSYNEALDIGNGPDDVAFAKWWISDPARKAATKELILSAPGWDPGDNIKNGVSTRDIGGNALTYWGETANHTDHMHLAIGSIPNTGGGAAPGATPGVSVSPYGSTIQYDANGVPIPGSGNSGVGSPVSWKDLPTRIAEKYQDALKPENVNKFIFGQAENVGQSLMGIGFSFLQGLTGIDIGSIYQPAQQILSHFTGDKSSGSDQTTLQQGSPMDNAIVNDLSPFDPNAGVDVNSIVSGLQQPNALAGTPGVTNQDAAALQSAAKQLLRQAGFSDAEWPPFKNIVDHESSWSPTAKNASGAFGLGQFLGHENDKYGAMGAYTTDPVKQLTAMIQYIKDRYQTPSAAWAHWQANNSYAAGGMVPARVSRGEYRMSPKAVSHYGVGLMNAVNGFAVGGMPFNTAAVPFRPQPRLPGGPDAHTKIVEQDPVTGRQLPPPVGSKPGVPPGATVPGLTTPGAGPGALPGPPPPAPPAPGVPAPAPGPGGFPPAQPLIDPALAAQQRGLGVVGSAPNSNTHLAQGWKGLIEGGFNAAGQAAATAGSIAGGMGMPGAGQGGQLIQSALQMAGQFASGAANVLASAGVGTIDQIGTQATPSGTPLLPTITPNPFPYLQTPDQVAAQSAPQQQGGGAGGPLIVNNYFGGIHTQNMDEWQRRQQLLERQQEQPLTSQFVH